MSAWVDLSVMTLTFILSIVWNLEAGIVISMILSLLLVVHRSSKTRMTVLVSTCVLPFRLPAKSRARVIHGLSKTVRLGVLDQCWELEM